MKLSEKYLNLELLCENPTFLASVDLSDVKLDTMFDKPITDKRYSTIVWDGHAVACALFDTTTAFYIYYPKLEWVLNNPKMKAHVINYCSMFGVQAEQEMTEVFVFYALGVASKTIFSKEEYLQKMEEILRKFE